MRPRRLSPDTLRPVHRVALIYSPIAAGVPLLTSLEKVQRRPGLGLRYLEAVLRGAGVQVDLYDNLYDPDAARRVHEPLLRGGYDLVGFHTTSASRGYAIATARQLRGERYAGRLLAGGPGVLHEDELLDSGFDLCFHGEGEERILPLVRAYGGGGAFGDIPGLCFDDPEGRRVRTGPAPLVGLEDLPFPDWTHHDPRYGDMFNVTLRRPYYVMMASRGCPFRCAFCARHQAWKTQYRARPVQHALDELEWLVKERGARYVHFLDDVFAWEPGWLEAFCDGVKQRDIRLHFSVVLHPLSFRGRQREVFERLAAVGCKLVSYGAQSADPQVLRNVGRSELEPEALADGVAAARELGLATVLTFIFGLPGATRQTIRHTTRFACRVKPTLADFHPLLYLPGSELGALPEGQRACGLDDAELNRLCWRANVDFYLVHGGLPRLSAFVLRHNPGWVRNLAPVGRWALEMARLVRDERGTHGFQ
jgi:anaerobic magnesium-protoporphyrin IX monomethyl ester cyclase